MPVRDDQRSAVYKWENAVFGSAVFQSAVPLQDIQIICRNTLDALGYKYPTPRIKDGRGTRKARGGRKSLNMPRWARNIPIICHELAHFIVIRKYESARAHGRFFIREYLKCLAVHGHDEEHLRASLMQHGIEH